ncbi:threonine--tRNA ligase [Candidatus Woesearchaeota archaeon]|nr:threonine--tRNA ligase [Candidatus Woesearchaeota archaeon]MBT5396894.1 threonine--tRNA ligase [Candidatus Woesearchaeota archaeon]MBT6367087.1 threonine--tRNA ligase [Candidatus Woesearchaeota archaeon]MBT7762339.1 threonine--tRNA ligase [Candidatus Woesearchaeota archaeon]
MKILTIHADFIEFKAKKKAIKDVADVDKVKKRAEECLVVFTAVEKRDEKNVDAIVEKYVQEIKNIAQQVNTKTIVLYPYAHLSSALSSPKVAEDVMKRAETILSDKYEVTRAPFGWYKSFTVACKGHPLSELSREFTVDGDNGKVVEKELNDTEIKSLLKQISRSRLDSSKLKDNDHRIIGKDLDLWSFNETAPGMVFWHNKGMIIKNLLIDYWREVHNKNGYQEISTPQIMDKKLWLLSGHWAKYKENMFITNYEKREFAVKPMNCPGGMLVYKASTKSYRDLPLRVGELGVVHRQELSGVLAGLFRLIQFTQDDAHIYCTEKQIESEVSKIIDIIKDMFSVFKLEFHHIELSTRPEKRIGTDDSWELAEKALENVLKEKKVEYTINEGDGAFYGPKIDFHLQDSLDRTWQCSTIQLDMALPERFDLEYTTKDGNSKRPIMLHRVVYGAIERFIGIITEHLNGKFPLWLSPVQVKVLTITDQNIPFAKEVIEKLQKANLRVELDDQSESMGKKVKDALNEKVNYIITIGDKEVEKKMLAVRDRSGKTSFDVDITEFIQKLVDEIKERVV